MTLAEPDAPVAEHRFPCDACGSDLRFDPEAHALRCDHCGNQALLPPPDPGARAHALREIDLREGLAQDLPPDQMETTAVTACPNCGARTQMEGGRTAGACPYCDTPVVASAPDRHIKPAAVLPFAMSEPRAKEAMRAWLGSLWFAPNGLTRYARAGRRMSGLYVPYWTFDARTRTRYRGQRGDNYVVRRPAIVDGKMTTVTRVEVRWRPVAGEVRLAFDDVLVLASEALPPGTAEGLEPWDLQALEPYRPAMLAGFRAEAYAVGLRDGLSRAKARMEAAIAGAVRRDIGGDHQRVHQSQTQVSDVTFKHVLLPVWIAAYRYRGKPYRFVVNARTGKVQGERPYSAWKIAVAVILGLIAAAAAAFVFAAAEGGGVVIIGGGGGAVPVGGDLGAEHRAPLGG